MQAADTVAVIGSSSSTSHFSSSSYDHDVIDVDQIDEDSEEEEEYDDEITFLPTRRSMSLSPSKSASSGLSAGRKKKSKTPVQRLRDFIGDILDADEALPDEAAIRRIHATPGVCIQGPSASVFTVLNHRPVLRVEVMFKLITMLRSCAAARQSVPSAHTKQANLCSAACVPEETHMIETDDLSRLMRLLHFSMQDAQHLDPFASTSRKRSTEQDEGASKRSRSDCNSPIKEIRKSKMSTVPQYNEVDESSEVQSVGEPNITTLGDVARRLSTLSYCAVAARCALNVLSSHYAPDSLRCEDALLPCIRVLRSMLQNTLMPLVHACADSSTGSVPLLSKFIESIGAMFQSNQKGKGKGKSTTSGSMETDNCRQGLNKVIEGLQHVLSNLSELYSMSGWAPSDASISLLASIIMPLLFANEPEPHSASAQVVKAGRATWSLLASARGDKSSLFASIRLPALDAIEKVYKHSTRTQQVFIINTILDHIGDVQETSKQGRRQYGLDNGNSIHSVTALILHLIHASALPIAACATRVVVQAGEQAAVEESQETIDDNEDVLMREMASSNALVDSLRQQLDKAREVATLFAEGLLAKVKSHKVAKGTSEVGLGSALDCVTHDLLETIFLPDWPASSLLLSHLSRLFIVCLEDRQSPPDLRGVAIDFLGLVAAKLQESQARMRILSSEKKERCEDVDRLNTVVEAKDSRPLATLEQAYSKLIRNLQVRSALQAVTQSSASQYLEAQWAVEVACVHRRVAERLDAFRASIGDEEEGEDITRLSNTLAALRESIGRMLESKQHASTGLCMITNCSQKNDEGIESIEELFETVLHTFNYMVPCAHIQDKLIDASSGPVAANRGKALRALSAMSQADGSFLQQAAVRSAIQRCLLDESVNVRDGAVALLGRFILANPCYIEVVFNSLKEKIDDSGLLVRKRTLRLIGDIYHKTSNAVLQAEAAAEVVYCLLDEEQSMQELAVHLAFNFWFCPRPNDVSSRKILNDMEQATQDVVITHAQIRSFTDVADRFPSRTSPLENLIRRLLAAESTHAPTKRQIDSLVEQLANRIAESATDFVDSAELTRFAKALTLLVRIQPSSLTVSQAKALLPRISLDVVGPETTMLAHLLEAFAYCIPMLSKVALSFAQQLQDLLRPLISQPSRHMNILPETVKCYANVIRHHTKDYAILIKTLQQCHRLLCGIVSKARSRKTVATADRNDVVIIRLTSLLVEAADFDLIRSEVGDVSASIDLVTRRSIKEEIVALLIRLLDNKSYVPHALLGLHFLFRSYPTLLMQDKVQENMLGILEHGQLQDRSILLRSIADVLTEEETRRSNENSACGFGELVGNTESLADPIGFEIMQTFLGPVLRLVSESGLQSVVLEIMQHIIMRGVCHPMECLPTLVALETLVDMPNLSAKAQSLHRHLILKVGSSISFRYATCARHSWMLHSALRGVNAPGVYGKRSVVQLWYETVVDNQPKQARLDLLKALIKAFDARTATLECSEDDVRYARFIAECLSVLDFRMADEVQYAVKELQTILDVSGEHVHIFAMEEVEIEGEEEQDEDDLEEEEIERVIVMGRMATILTYAIYLRQHLVQQFGLSDNGKTATLSTTKASSSKPASRKVPATSLRYPDSSSHSRHKRDKASLSHYQRAKQEMSHFDNLMST